MLLYFRTQCEGTEVICLESIDFIKVMKSTNLQNCQFGHLSSLVLLGSTDSISLETSNYHILSGHAYLAKKLMKRRLLFGALTPFLFRR